MILTLYKYALTITGWEIFQNTSSCGISNNFLSKFLYLQNSQHYMPKTFIFREKVHWKSHLGRFQVQLALLYQHGFQPWSLVEICLYFFDPKTIFSTFKQLWNLNNFYTRWCITIVIGNTFSFLTETSIVIYLRFDEIW